jgi:hypothetical protein
MKRYIFYFLAPALFFLLIIGCAQWGGDTPLGITGGSEDGYGKTGDLAAPATSDGQVDDQLIGSWRSAAGGSQYTILTFYANGDFEIDYYYQDQYWYGLEGTYSVSGNMINMYFDGDSDSGTYSITGNRLIITTDGRSTTYYRD